MADHNARLGAHGEQLVATWYRQQGHTVVDRNWRAGRAGELDLVIVDGSILIFCEVKTRSSTAYGTPAEAVTIDKQRRIRRLAGQWMAEHDVRPATVRFDVAGVVGHSVDVRLAAF